MSFKHYTLTFDVKAAGLTDISMEEPVAQVAMRHELLDQPDEMIQRRGRGTMFRGWARQASRDLIFPESGDPGKFSFEFET
jgi:hypothetical protein